jgi:DtxR family Mn-dependent transcriptional regulator
MEKTYSKNVSRLLTAAHEDYLKTIYLLQRRHEIVTNAALAEAMSVAPASATNMVKKLDDLDLVEHIPYQGMTLTTLGEQVALEVLRHHRLVELFLHQALGMSWDQIHDEADRLEHVISEQLEDAIASSLGNPLIDPHGDPIPGKDGEVAPVGGCRLSEAATGKSHRLVRVLVQDSERLVYLAKLGLLPGARLTVHARAPFDGPLLVGVDGERHALAHELAVALLVSDA